MGSGVGAIQAEEGRFKFCGGVRCVHGWICNGERESR